MSNATIERPTRKRQTRPTNRRQSSSRRSTRTDEPVRSRRKKSVQAKKRQSADHVSQPVRQVPQSQVVPLQASPAETSKPQSRGRTRISLFERKPLESSFILFGYLVAIGLILFFGIDLAIAWPFWRASVSFDVAAIVCGIGLAYLSWDAQKGLR